MIIGSQTLKGEYMNKKIKVQTSTDKSELNLIAWDNRYENEERKNKWKE